MPSASIRFAALRSNDLLSLPAVVGGDRGGRKLSAFNVLPVAP